MLLTALEHEPSVPFGPFLVLSCLQSTQHKHSQQMRISRNSSHAQVGIHAHQAFAFFKTKTRAQGTNRA